MQYFDNNGYLDAAMIQKKFMIAKPDEWIERNLGKKFVRIDNFYFKEDKL